MTVLNKIKILPKFILKQFKHFKSATHIFYIMFISPVIVIYATSGRKLKIENFECESRHRFGDQ